MLQPATLSNIAAAAPVKAVGVGVLAGTLYDALDALDALLANPPTGLQRAFARSEVTIRANSQRLGFNGAI